MKSKEEILLGRKAFQIYFEPLGSQIETLSDEEAGKLFKAVYKYARDDETPDFDDRLLATLFASQKTALDIDKEKYIERCRKNTSNINKRWLKDTSEYDGIRSYTNYTDTDTDTDTEIDTDTVHAAEGKEGRGTYGELGNVYLTREQYSKLQEQYTNVSQLINKVSRWLPNSEKPIRDHYSMCLTFADRDNWPRRPKEPEPVKPVHAVPMPEETKEKLKKLGYGNIIGNTKES